jgi:hypothetical protein
MTWKVHRFSLVCPENLGRFLREGIQDFSNRLFKIRDVYDIYVRSFANKEKIKTRKTIS